MTLTHSQPKGNKLFLVCTVCGADTDTSLELARRKNEGYEKVMPSKLIEAWFDKHASCGDGRDHFKLGQFAQSDWDKAIPVSPDSHVGAHVRLALIKSDRAKA